MYDVVIIGSGMGGATLAASLAERDKNHRLRVLILERGEPLTMSATARDDAAIFGRGVYKPRDTWLDGAGRAFTPGNYYCAGGNAKFYGAVLLRYRQEDFAPIRHIGGETAGWPMDYATLEPWYQQAETLYAVRGVLGEDATEPAHSGDYAYPPVPDEPAIAEVRARLKRVGLNPASLPLGVDIAAWQEGGATGWDGFPNPIPDVGGTGGKMDAESVGLKRALSHPNITIRYNAEVVNILTDDSGDDGDADKKSGKVRAVVVKEGQGAKKIDTIPARVVVVAAGAVQTAALLLRAGLANRSDQVGRNFMNHNTSAVMAIHPFRKNNAVYQKTLMVNDFYAKGGPNGEPLGNAQLLGKITGNILAANARLPKALARMIAARSVDWYAMSEDLPNPDSRVMVKGDKVVLDWRPSNLEAHRLLVATFKKYFRRAGYPIVISRAFDHRTPSHQCGTARMGDNPRESVVNSFGRTHDHRNLFICDAAILPTSAAVNPALTIAALALRTGAHLYEHDLAA